MTYLPNLTAVRGVAAALVLLFHIELYCGLVARHSSTEFLSRGYLMVDVFFVLSGFIMSHVYRDRVLTGGMHAIREFVVARFARIYPLHVLTLLYVVGLVELRFRADPGAWTPQQDVLYASDAVPLNLLLLQGMNTTEYASWNYPSWSISTEWWAYLMFPLLAGPLARWGHARLAAIAACCFATYVVLMLVLIPRVTVPAEFSGLAVDPSRMTVDATYQFGFVRCLAGFVLGMVVYRMYEAKVGQRYLRGPAALTLIAAMALCMHRGYPDPVTLGLVPPLMLTMAYGSPGIDAVLLRRPLQRLGGLVLRPLHDSDPTAADPVCLNVRWRNSRAGDGGPARGVLRDMRRGLRHPCRTRTQIPRNPYARRGTPRTVGASDVVRTY